MGRLTRAGKDLVLGIIMILISLYLLISPDIVAGITLLDSSIVLARAGTYVRILGGVLFLLAVSISIRALMVIKAKTEELEEKQPMDPLVVTGFVMLLLYMPLMNLTGFTTASIVFTSVFAFMIRAREKKVDLHNPKEFYKNLIIAFLYAVVLELVLEFVFTELLNVNLP